MTNQLFLGNKTPHINHWNCTPVLILDEEDDQLLVSPMTVGPDWDCKWVSADDLHGISVPEHLTLDKGQPTDLGRHTIISGGEVLEL